MAGYYYAFCLLKLCTKHKIRKIFSMGYMIMISGKQHLIIAKVKIDEFFFSLLQLRAFGLELAETEATANAFIREIGNKKTILMNLERKYHDVKNHKVRRNSKTKC
jgi:hypothetical protein